MGQDFEKMIAVGIVWGATNAFMRRGAQIWDEKLRSSRLKEDHRILARARRWLDLLLVWQYTIPFVLNLSASAAFFYVLSNSPISVAVPVTNAVTFAATAVFGVFLGEEMRLGHAIGGTCLIVLGISLCIS